MDCQQVHSLGNLDHMSSYSEQVSLQIQNKCLFCNNKIGSDYPYMIQKALCTKYSSSQSYFFTQDINDILQEHTTAFTVKFDEDQIWDEEQQFLKRLYQQQQFPNKIKILSQYYKYHFDVPRIYTKYICIIFNDYHDQRRQFDYKRLKKVLKEQEDSIVQDTDLSKNKYSLLLEDLRLSMQQFERKKNLKLNQCEQKKKDWKRPEESTLLAELMSKLNEITKFQVEKSLSFSLSGLEFSKNFIELQGKKEKLEQGSRMGIRSKNNQRMENLFKKKKRFKNVKDIRKIKNIEFKKKNKKIENKDQKHKNNLTNCKEEDTVLYKQLTNRLSDEIFQTKKISNQKKIIFDKQKKSQQSENKKLICNAKINIHINNALFLTNGKKNKKAKEQIKSNLKSLDGYQKQKHQLLKTYRRPSFIINKSKESGTSGKHQLSLQKIYMEKKNIKKHIQKNLSIQNKVHKKKLEGKQGNQIVEKKKDEISEKKIIRKSSQKFSIMPQKSKSVSSVKKIDSLDFNKQNSNSFKKKIDLDIEIYKETGMKNSNFRYKDKLIFSKKIDDMLTKKLENVDKKNIYSKMRKQ